jgi:hypothetical protein
LPPPFECEPHASPESPRRGVSIRLDPALLVELRPGRQEHRREQIPGNERHRKGFDTRYFSAAIRKGALVMPPFMGAAIKG